MRIVVLAKPVPDATGQERLRSDGRLERSAAPAVLNGNDEYTLEAALRLVDAHGGEVTLVAMAPSEARDALRKGLAMGATRAVLVSDERLAGSCTLSTMLVLAATLRTLDFDLVLAGAAAIDEAGTNAIHVRRISGAGQETVEVPLPALVVGTQLLGEPRYPTLKGIMGSRAKEIAVRTLADLGLAEATVGGGSATTVVVAQRTPAARTAARIVRGTAEAAAREVVDFLVERRALR